MYKYTTLLIVTEMKNVLEIIGFLYLFITFSGSKNGLKVTHFYPATLETKNIEYFKKTIFLNKFSKLKKKLLKS